MTSHDLLILWFLSNKKHTLTTRFTGMGIVRQGLSLYCAKALQIFPTCLGASLQIGDSRSSFLLGILTLWHVLSDLRFCSLMPSGDFWFLGLGVLQPEDAKEGSFRGLPHFAPHPLPLEEKNKTAPLETASLSTTCQGLGIGLRQPLQKLLCSPFLGLSRFPSVPRVCNLLFMS